MKLTGTYRALPRSQAVFAAAFLSAALAGCGSTAPRPEQVEAVPGLTVEVVQPQTIPDEIEVPGSSIAAATAQLAARTTGTVTQVLAREGDIVTRGQLLAQLDESELLARRDAARAALQQASAGVGMAARGLAAAQAQAGIAKKTYDRYVYLRDQKSVSPQEFDEIEAKNLAAQAGLAQAAAAEQQAEAAKAEAQSSARAAEDVAGYARIVAPFDGRVVRRTVDPGSLAAPGMDLFVVEDISHYQLNATLPAEAIATHGGFTARVRKGSKARVEFDALPGRSFEGIVAELEAGADPRSHTVQARINLPRDSQIQSGLFGRAWFQRGERQAILVPKTAVIERGQLHGVYVADARGIAQWRVVTLGQPFADQVEILSGVQAGEQIVSNPGVQELDGKRVGTASGAPEGRQ